MIHKQPAFFHRRKGPTFSKRDLAQISVAADTGEDNFSLGSRFGGRGGGLAAIFLTQLWARAPVRLKTVTAWPAR